MEKWTCTYQCNSETAVDAIILINNRGIVAEFNPAAERMFGYSAEEVLGKNIKMLMPSPHQENHDGYLANYMKTREKKIIGIGREVQGNAKMVPSWRSIFLSLN
ncbi:MAG: PAS domain S-box protein [Planctomycetaceae bacterium]